MEPPGSGPTNGGDLERARRLLELGQPGAALRWADAVLASQPGDVSAHLVRAAALLELEQFDAAGEASRQALALAPEDPRTSRMRALTLLRVGSPSECLRMARLACQLDPESPQALHVRVDAELLNNLAAAARSTAARLLQAAPHQHSSHEAAGRAALAAGAWAEADGHFRRALELDPECTGSLGNLALSLELRGRLGESLDLLHQAARIAPDDRHVRFSLRRVIGLRAARQFRPFLAGAGAWLAYRLLTRSGGWLSLAPATQEYLDSGWLVVLAVLLGVSLRATWRARRDLHPELQAFERAADRRAWPGAWRAGGTCLLLCAALLLVDQQLRPWGLDPLTYVVCAALAGALVARAVRTLLAGRRIGHPRLEPQLPILLLAPLLTAWHKLVNPVAPPPWPGRALLLLCLSGLACLGLGLAIQRGRRP